MKNFNNATNHGILTRLCSVYMRKEETQMSKKKWYAVKKGLQVGIFETWSECEAVTKGYPQAEYKSFSTREEADAYICGEDVHLNKIKQDLHQGYLVAYVDGSFNNETDEFSYGVLIFDKNSNEIELYEKFKHKDYGQSKNIAGEIYGVLVALDWALSHEYSKIKIYHDYEGLSKWATGEWKANKEVSKHYIKVLKEKFYGYIDYEFVKVKGHSNNPYNDKADKLAEQAIKGNKKIITSANSFTVTDFTQSNADKLIETIRVY